MPDNTIIGRADQAWQSNDDDRYATQQALSPKGSEDWLALEFARRHHHELRHIAATRRWLKWDGHRWAEDRTTAVFDLIRPIVREFAATLDASTQQPRKAATAARVVAVERLALSDRRLAATLEQWDADQFVLNTPGGLVYLRSGNLHTSDPLAYCTKITAVAPAEFGTPAPRWEKFLVEITNGDRNLIDFLQRMAGYALTGDTSEHALFFGYGTGANGKSVLTDTLATILGDYATTAPADIFLASKNERHPTEIADLRGARLVVASELDQGRRWNEARIKALTGGDPVKARLMRQDFFEFRPQFKLLIVGNSKPGLLGVDEAMRRRLHMVPFRVTIVRQARDTHLTDKLRAEGPAILRWAINGCLAWQQNGLSPPVIVTSATEAYLSSEDSIGQWLDDSCVTDANAWTSSADLFASWQAWAETNGEAAGSRRHLAQVLETHSLRLHRGAGGVRGFQGVRLRK